MELALRRAYGYAYGPKIRKRAGFGMGSVEVCSDGTEPDDTGACANGSIPAVDPSVTNADPGFNIVPTVDASGNPLASNTIDDKNGVPCTVAQWDAINNLCPGSSGYSNSSTGVGTATATQLATALAAAAAAVARGVTGSGVGINCGNGMTVPVGSACIGAPAGSVCPSGFTLSGTTCTSSLIGGISNSTLVLIGIAFVAFIAMSGKK